MNKTKKGHLPAPSVAKLAVKLQQAYQRGCGRTKIPAFDALTYEAQAGWVSAAEIAIANVCDPAQCVHIEAARTQERAPIEALKAELAKYPPGTPDEAEALGDVLADLDDGIAAAVCKADFEAVYKLVGFKAALYGLR